MSGGNVAMNAQRDITDLLKKHPGLKAAWLFGSLARGKEVFESDLDVAVLCEKPLSVEEKLAIIEELAILSGRPVDLVDLQATDGPIIRQILQTGMQLFCTDAHLYAELIKRQVFYEADFMPYRRRILQKRLNEWISS